MKWAFGAGLIVGSALAALLVEFLGLNRVYDSEPVAYFGPEDGVQPPDPYVAAPFIVSPSVPPTRFWATCTCPPHRGDMYVGNCPIHDAHTIS